MVVARKGLAASTCAAAVIVATAVVAVALAVAEEAGMVLVDLSAGEAELQQLFYARLRQGDWPRFWQQCLDRWL